MKIRSEMLPFSENIKSTNNFRIAPEQLCHSLGYVHNDNSATGQYCITICHSEQLQEDLMVFSDNSLHISEYHTHLCVLHSPTTIMYALTLHDIHTLYMYLVLCFTCYNV